MTIDVRVPRIGINMTEGTLSEWLKADGATVVAGEPLYSLEMDKSTTEVEAPASGTLSIIATIDQSYQVGELLATIA
jgi:pyruvate/2-oxoglutarate dehydrogenase complex dihydrolipoamide acyltransferase (E2) component